MAKNKHSKFKPLERSFYAFNFIKAGDFLVYVQTLNGYYEFISLPGPSIINIAFEDFEKSIKDGVLSFVEQLPEDIFNETVDFANNTKQTLSCPTRPSIIDIETTYEK